MTRTLVTGVAGFTGPYIARLLAERGHEVHGITHGHDGTSLEGVRRTYEADIADLDAITKIVDEVRPARVVHLAGIAFVAHTNIEQMYRANIVGTRQLLEALTQLPEPPRSIVLASSANVYGNTREGVLDESMPRSPANDYGVTKVAMEHLGEIYGDRLPITVVRPFNYTGRGQSTEFVIPKIIAHARQKAPVIELGNLDVRRDFSDVRAVAEAYVRLLECPQAAGGTYNVCSGQAYSLREVIDLVEDLSGHQMTVTSSPAYFRANELQTLYGSNERLVECIGPLEVPPLAETLRWMLEA